MPTSLPGSWEDRLERLRPTWRERGEKLERLLRAARVVLPVTLSVEAIVLIVSWNETIIRIGLIEFLAIAVYGLLHVFYWLLPRQREVFRIPFDEYVAKMRIVRRGPFITPRGVVSAAFAIAGMVFLGLGSIFSFVLPFGGGDPRAGIRFIGFSLWCAALGNLFGFPSFRKVDTAVLGHPFTGRLLLSASVAAIGGAILILLLS